MNAAAKWGAIALVTAVITHGVIVVATPYAIMGMAMERIGQGGLRTNKWNHSPRTTEASRAIVRPSPDLAYSSCVYDVSKGPVRITAAPWDDYMSLSLFSANTDNFYAINDSQAPQGVDIVLIRAGAPKPEGAAVVVESPSDTGIALQRRLAPTQERFEKAAAARKDDVCIPLGPRG